MAEQRAVCAAVPVRALLQLPLLGVNRGYKGLYGGGWPLRGMGAAGTALGAADARTNENIVKVKVIYLYFQNPDVPRVMEGSTHPRTGQRDPRVKTLGTPPRPHLP